MKEKIKKYLPDLVFSLPGLGIVLLMDENVLSGERRILLLLIFTWYTCWGVFVFWRRANQMRHASDTPRSKIGSAAQGYVELQGTLKQAENGATLCSPFSHTPCLWWEYEVERRSKDDDWSTIEEVRCRADWLHIHDDTGQCLIDPAGANTILRKWKTYHEPPQRPDSSKLRNWENPSYRYTERILRPGQALYALGDFRSTRGQHVLKNPGDGRPFILSDQEEAGVIHHFRGRATGGMGIFFLGLEAFSTTCGRSGRGGECPAGARGENHSGVLSTRGLAVLQTV